MPQPKVIYEDISPGALEDSTITSANYKYFSAPENLRAEKAMYKAATGEPDRWLLDGSAKLFPDDPTDPRYSWGLWSNEMCDGSGNFSTPPEIQITFGHRYSSVGVSFEFEEYSNDYPAEIQVRWYQGDELLAEQAFAPNSWKYSCIKEISLFDKIVVKFPKMSKPYRYLKIQRVMIGIERIFELSELVSVSLLEELSPISEELSINKTTTEIDTDDPIPYLFQRKQPIYLYHGDNLLGVSYLDKGTRKSETQYTIESFDAVGVLDESEFKGGIYQETSITDILDAIFQGTYLSYQLDPAFGDTKITGWIPKSTRREALQLVAFSVGAVVSTARSDKVNIYSLSDEVVATIGETRVFTGGDMQIESPITEVQVTAHQYQAKESETQELYNGDIDGQIEVSFSDPMHSLSVSGATIIESNANYAIIQGSGTVVLTGQKYNHITSVLSVINPDVGESEPTNAVVVEDATLITPSNVKKIAGIVYDHYQKKSTVEQTIVLQDEAVGDTVTVHTPWQGTHTGVITSLDITVLNELSAEAAIVCE